MAEAQAYFKKKGYTLSPEKHQKLIRRDKERQKKYGETQIELRNVNFDFGSGPVLNNLNLSVKKGEFIAILGQNGSGKTTLIKQLNGLLVPKQGTAVVNGRDTSKESVKSLSQIVGYVFQNPDHQIIMETVYDDVAFGPRFAKLDEKEIKKRVDEALAAVKLTGREKSDPLTLTKGQRQKVAVAAVLANKPDILVLDEPTTGLDDNELRGMMELIKSLNDDGHTIIMVTHCMWVAAEYAHRVVVLKQGEVLLDGPAREVFAQEEKLRECHLRPPQITGWSRQLGHTLLSVAEFRECLIHSTSSV